jgi:hypothetical protein
MMLAPRWRRGAVAALIVLDLSAAAVVLWNANPIAHGMYRFFDHCLTGDDLTGAR